MSISAASPRTSGSGRRSTSNFVACPRRPTRAACSISRCTRSTSSARPLPCPESIRVKIDSLQLGQAIHVKELELPAGVKVLEDPDLVVVQVKQQVVHRQSRRRGSRDRGGVAAEPEIITKKKEKPAEEE